MNHIDQNHICVKKITFQYKQLVKSVQDVQVINLDAYYFPTEKPANYKLKSTQNNVPLIINEINSNNLQNIVITTNTTNLAIEIQLFQLLQKHQKAIIFIKQPSSLPIHILKLLNPNHQIIYDITVLNHHKTVKIHQFEPNFQ